MNTKKARQRKRAPARNSSHDKFGEGSRTYNLRNYPASWHAFVWIIYLCYCYAAFVPKGPVWGIHFIAYIPIGLKLLLLIVGGMLLLPNVQLFFFKKITSFFHFDKQQQKIRIVLPTVIALVFFVIFHLFTIRTNIYGDEINMVRWYGNNAIFDWQWILDILSPHWVENKEALTISLHRVVAHLFSLPIDTTYRLVSELCGAVFVFLWLIFTQKVASGPVRLVLATIGISAGALQVFFGHIENYSFGILTSVFFLCGLYFYIEGKLRTIFFILLYLLALKAHIIAAVLFPAFILGLIWHYKDKFPRLAQVFSWKGLMRLVIIPTLLAGLLLYIFVFHSWNKPYAFVEGFQLSQSFLPVIPSPPPLDHYMLWSPYHIADFLNLLLMVAAPVIILLITLLIYHRKELSWTNPKVMIFGVAALFPFIFFLAMNPQLTPLRDWDIYTLLLPPLLFFTAVLITESKITSHMHSWFSQGLVFGVLFTAVFVSVNASPIESVLRLHDGGAYIYRSYYAGSSYILTCASPEDSSRIVREHLTATVKELAIGWKPGKNRELAGSMATLASLYGSNGNYTDAIIWADASRQTDTTNGKYAQYLASYYVQSGKNDEAADVIEDILQRRIPTGTADHLDKRKLAATMIQLADRFQKQGNQSAAMHWSEMAATTDSLSVRKIVP